MYTNTNGLLSLGNIHQIAKGGMATLKKRGQNGGIVPAVPREQQPEETMETMETKEAEAEEQKQEEGTPEQQPEGVKQQPEEPTEAEPIQGQQSDNKEAKVEVEDTNKNLKRVTILLEIIIVSGILMFIASFIIYIIDLRKISNIKPENRYNMDLIEYKMAKLPKPIRNPYLIAYTIMAILPFFILIISPIYMKNANKPGIIKTTITLFIIVLITVAIVTIVAYTIPYLGFLKELKRIKTRIDVFENYVYNNFYLNSEMLQILYNKGAVPESANAIIRKAIFNTLLLDYELNPQILSDDGKPDTDKIMQIAYTLHMYKFLNTDLINDEDRLRYYKTNSMSIFDARLIMLPGKSRVFKIADYMRSNTPANMDDASSISNILATMNRILKLNSNTINRIKFDIKNKMRKTRSLAYNIRAYSARRKLNILVLMSLIMFGIVGTFIGFLIIKT
jgi:hypothetical protein